MSQLREVIELVFGAGHAAGVVDATEERERGCGMKPSRLELLTYGSIALLGGLMAWACWPEPTPKSPEKLTHSQERDTTRP